MRVILIDWNAYGMADIENTLVRRGYDIRKCPFDDHIFADKRSLMLTDIRSCIGSFHPDYVFSYHYFPDISDICESEDTPYLAWIYDSPVFDLYSPTVLNHVNRIFVFDRGVADEFETGGIMTVHYMPLAVCAREGLVPGVSRYDSDVTFIGSMYSESKHRLYDKFASVSPFARGYLDAIIEAQKHMYGVNFLEKFITPEIESEMQKAYPTDPNSRNIMSPAKLYSQFVLSRQVTALERREIMEMLGKYSPAESGDSDTYRLQQGLRIRLYTHDTALHIPGIQNMGPINYGPDMYRVFASSKINLNITLRSILTGIPLRALDIMSCGGFLLSNYQEELCEYFVPGEDFDYYEEYTDLMAKIDYYLTHDDIRRNMARSAMERIRADHSLDARFNAMERYL